MYANPVFHKSTTSLSNQLSTHPPGVSVTLIASTAHVMTHRLKFTFMPQAQPVNFHREVSLTLLYFLSHFSQQNH